jgi:hypothetical protein
MATSAPGYVLLDAGYLSERIAAARAGCTQISALDVPKSVSSLECDSERGADQKLVLTVWAGNAARDRAVEALLQQEGGSRSICLVVGSPFIVQLVVRAHRCAERRAGACDVLEAI